jgi:hypothetical protein
VVCTRSELAQLVGDLSSNLAGARHSDWTEAGPDTFQTLVSRCAMEDRGVGDRVADGPSGYRDRRRPGWTDGVHESAA